MDSMLHVARGEQVMKYSFNLMRHGGNRKHVNEIPNMEFQSPRKYEPIFVFVTQNVFGNNSRNKLADWTFQQKSMTLIHCIHCDMLMGAETNR